MRATITTAQPRTGNAPLPVPIQPLRCRQTTTYCLQEDLNRREIKAIEAPGDVPMTRRLLANLRPKSVAGVKPGEAVLALTKTAKVIRTAYGRSNTTFGPLHSDVMNEKANRGTE